MKTFGLLLATLVAIALLGGVIAGRMVLSFVGAPYEAQRTEPKIVEIPADLGPAALSERLAEAGLVADREWMRLYVEHLRRDLKVIPGEYALSASLSPAEILDRLGRGAVVTYPITVSPGDTAAKIFAAIAAQNLAPRGVLEAILRDASFINRLGLPGSTLEGYLWPDTYTFSRGMSAEAMLERMAQGYQKGLPPKLLEDARARGLTEAELVIVASLVERSGLKESEWPEYAALIHNRLKDQLPLEHEAALAYALEKDTLEAPDYGADTMYNTFRHTGLPPTAIASPGLAALAAAAQPKGEGRYLAPKPDSKGDHVFCVDEECVRAAYERVGQPVPPPRFVKPKGKSRRP